MAGLGKPVDLSTFLTRRCRNRVDRIGVELEGGWIKMPPRSRLVRDASVKGPGLRNDDDEYLLPHVGELPSPLLSLDPKDNNFWEDWMIASYPKVVNYTCGMHVHMSFDRMPTYTRLVDPTYPGTLIKYIIEWAKDTKLSSDHPIWSRLSGDNEYCQHIFHAREQLKTPEKDYDHHRKGHRYTVVHYPWNRHSTVEVRLLPMMATPQQSIDVIKYLLKVTNAYLLTTKEQPKKLSAKLTDKGDVVRENRRVVV